VTVRSATKSTDTDPPAATAGKGGGFSGRTATPVPDPSRHFRVTSEMAVGPALVTMATTGCMAPTPTPNSDGWRTTVTVGAAGAAWAVPAAAPPATDNVVTAIDVTAA